MIKIILLECIEEDPDVKTIRLLADRLFQEFAEIEILNLDAHKDYISEIIKNKNTPSLIVYKYEIDPIVHRNLFFRNIRYTKAVALKNLHQSYSNPLSFFFLWTNESTTTNNAEIQEYLTGFNILDLDDQSKWDAVLMNLYKNADKVFA